MIDSHASAHYFSRKAQRPVWDHMLYVIAPGWYYWNERLGHYFGPYDTKEECQENYKTKTFDHEEILRKLNLKQSERSEPCIQLN